MAEFDDKDLDDMPALGRRILKVMRQMMQLNPESISCPHDCDVAEMLFHGRKVKLCGLCRCALSEAKDWPFEVMTDLLR